MAKLSISILEHQKRADQSYPISIRLGHRSKSAYMDTGKYAKSWQVAKVKGTKGTITITDRGLLLEVLTIIEDYEKELKKLGMVTEYTIGQLTEYLEAKRNELKIEKEVSIDFVSFARKHIEALQTKGKVKTAGTFASLINSLGDYMKRPMLFSREINKRFLGDFSDYLATERTITRRDQLGILRTKKVPPMGGNAMYGRMKDFRTLFYLMKAEHNNEDIGYIPIPQNPFKGFKISQPEPQPSGVDMSEIVRLYNLYYQYHTMSKRERFAINMFFLSFFLVGMNAIDLLNLKAKDQKKDRLNYNRTKTKTRRKDAAFISIKIEPEAEPYITEYRDEKNSLYVLTLHLKYTSPDALNRAIDKGLESLCERNELPKVTMYVARHSWASIARNECGVIKDDISLALNHRSADKGSQTTDIYLKKDWSLIDRANRKVIDFFLKQLEP